MVERELSNLTHLLKDVPGLYGVRIEACKDMGDVALVVGERAFPIDRMAPIEGQIRAALGLVIRQTEAFERMAEVGW